MIAGLILIGSIILLAIVLGVVFYQGKGAYLIAGYNMMTKEEQAKYDVPAMTKFMGKSMFALAGSMVFYFFGILFDKDIFFYIGTVMMIGIALFMVIYSNSGNRFKKKMEKE